MKFNNGVRQHGLAKGSQPPLDDYAKDSAVLGAENMLLEESVVIISNLL